MTLPFMFLTKVSINRQSVPLHIFKHINSKSTIGICADCIILQSGDTESHRNFPSKSCPLRYGPKKIKEDALNLFQAGLREYVGSIGISNHISRYRGWGITSLSVSASKIVAVPAVSSKFSFPPLYHAVPF